MLYDRQIRYLDYIVSGERVQAAGFVKAEVRDEICRMQIHVNGLHLSDSFERKVILQNAERDSYLTMIRIEGGKGDTGEMVLNTSRMGSGNISYGGLEQIIIPIDNEKEIRCIWNIKAVTKNVNGNEEGGHHETGSSEIRNGKAEHEESGRHEAGNSEIENGIAGLAEADNKNSESDEFNDKESSCKREVYVADENMPDEIDRVECIPDGMESMEYEIKESDKSEDMHAAQITPDEIYNTSHCPLDNKWRQLSALYNHGEVFGEMSDCLLIRPGDFVILPDKYYRLVNNSFLLHGYHNYGYLVLARTEKRGEIKYYIGVPGNFFEKEKQVAIMFGFESFECGKSYIQPGDFGYYMIRVEL